MGLRCELCDAFLPLLQFSNLCLTCYKVRTIAKVYDAESILKCLENNFMVSKFNEEQVKAKDKEYFHKEEIRLNQELLEQLQLLETLNTANEAKAKLSPIVEEETPIETKYTTRSNKKI
tara:strand:- start:1488 stop:1844 length:357 start_codon:yes stop_codon:yes gene_type:complete